MNCRQNCCCKPSKTLESILDGCMNAVWTRYECCMNVVWMGCEQAVWMLYVWVWYEHYLRAIWTLYVWMLYVQAVWTLNVWMLYERAVWTLFVLQRRRRRWRRAWRRWRPSARRRRWVGRPMTSRAPPHGPATSQASSSPSSSSPSSSSPWVLISSSHRGINELLPFCQLFTFCFAVIFQYII